MSLRDFDTPLSDDPIALHHEPVGNGAGLSNFHTVSPEERESNNTPKIVGAVAVALMVGAAAIGFYASMGPSHNTVVAVAPKSPPPALMQPAAATDTAAPMDAAPASEPAAIQATPKSAPVRTARMAIPQPVAVTSPQAAQTTPVQEQAQATPLPPAPAPSPSDVAIANPEPVAPEAPQVSTAPQELQSSTPQASDAAPAQDQQSGATPPPAQ